MSEPWFRAGHATPPASIEELLGRFAVAQGILIGVYQLKIICHWSTQQNPQQYDLRLTDPDAGGVEFLRIQFSKEMVREYGALPLLNDIRRSFVGDTFHLASHYMIQVDN